MAVYFNNRKYIDDKIAELGGAEGIPKYRTFEDLPETATEGSIAVVMDEDYIYIYDSQDAIWKISGIRPEDLPETGGGGGTGDLTKEQADDLYSPKTHTHTEFSEIQSRLDAIGNGMVFKEEVAYFSDIPEVKEQGDTFVVTEDATKEGRRTLYTFNGVDLVYLGTFGVVAGVLIDDETPSFTTTYSGNKINELIENIPTGGTGDLTKEQADELYSGKEHTHAEFGSFLTSEDLEGIGGETGESIEVFETKPNASNLEIGQKIIAKNKWYIVKEDSSEDEPTPRFGTKEELTQEGFGTIVENTYATGSNQDAFLAFDTSDTTYTAVLAAQNYAEAGKIGLAFDKEKTIGRIELMTGTSYFPSDFGIEVSQNGSTWTQIVRFDNETNGGNNYPTTPNLFYDFTPTRARYARIVVYARGFSKSTGGSSNRAFFYKLIFHPPNVDAVNVLKPLLAETETPAGYKNVLETPTIQETLDQGGLIYFPSGEYLINESLRVPSNTHIKMCENAVLKRNSGSVKSIFTNKSDGTIGGHTANENITIEGGTLDGNYTAFPAGTEREFGLVAIAHSKNWKILNTIFRNQDRWHMIEINSSHNVLIENCKFYDYHKNDEKASEAVQVDFAGEAQFPMNEGKPWDGTMCSNIFIRNCEFERVHHAIGSHSGIASKLHRKIVIEKCQFRNLTGFVVQAVNWEDVDFEHNLIEVAKDGIRFYLANTNSGRIRIANNRFFTIGYNAGTYDDTARAISVAGTVDYLFNRIEISGNFISQVGKYGIGFDYGQNVVVNRNFIQNVYRTGIWSYGGKKVMITENTVENAGIVGTLNTQSIKVGETTPKGDKGVVVANNRMDTFYAENTDGVAFVNNIHNANGTKLLTNTNFIESGNIAY